MKEYVLIFRNSVNPEQKPTQEQVQKIMTDWMNWMGSIAAQNLLADKGNRLSMTDAKTVQANDVVTDGPFTEIKEFINGYIIVKANHVDDAVAIAKNCPILLIGGNVEVRKVVTPDDNS